MPASRADPAARRPDAFLSYSRRDREIADRLVALLAERGKDVWVNMQDIPAASRWRDELARAIEVSDAVIALVTPAWIASRNCRQELEHADSVGKRIIPVLAAPTADVPDALAARQWVELGSGADWGAAIEEIVEAIESDLPYVRAHARYLEESQRWNAVGRDRGFLLRGGELRAAEAWLATRSDRPEPRPTTDQIAFIQASRSDATRRLRILTASALAAVAAVIVLGLLALVQRNVAVDREHTARSRELAALSDVRRSSDPEAAVKLAVEALDVKHTREAEIGLGRAIAASPVVARFGGPRDEVDDAAMTADGTTVVTARDDGVVRAFATASGRRRWTWAGTPGLQVVTIAAGDREVAVGQGAGDITVLDIATGAPLERFAVGAKGALTGAVPSPDDRTIAGVTADLGSLASVLKLWERGSGRLIADLSAGGESAQRPVFSPDGTRLVVPYRSGLTRVWDARSGRLLHVLAGHSGPVNRADIDPRGRWIATGSDDGGVRVWSLSSGRQRSVLRSSGDAINAVRFSPDGARVAGAGRDGAVHVWETASGALLASLTGHEGGVGRVQFVDENTLVSGGDDGTARVWDLERARQAMVLLGHGLGVSVAPGAQASHVLTVGAEGTARVWRLPGTDTVTIGDPGSVGGIAVGLDGRRVVTVDARRPTVSLWAVAQTGAPRRLRSGGNSLAGDISADGSVFAQAGDGLRLFDRDGAPLADLGVGERTYSAVAVGPDGRRVAASRAGEGVNIWDPASNAPIASVPAAGLSLVTLLRFSRDGSTLAFSDAGAPVVVVAAESGEIAGSVPTSAPLNLPAFAIDPTGERVFRLDYRLPEKPAIVDVATGARTRLSGNPSSSLDSAEFSADGSELLTAGGRGAQIWDTGTGGLRAEIARDLGRTRTAAFSPDDRLVVTGHDDGLVRVWDRATGAQLGEFDGGPGPVTRLAAGFGGTRIFALGKDLTVRMFTCDACATGDQLTELSRRHVAFGDLDGP